MIARRLPWPGADVMLRQLAGAWICGSVLMGTVALIFLRAEPRVAPLPCPVWLREPPCPQPSLFQLSPLARLAVFALAVLLFVALAVLGWRTASASWLTGDARARLLWVAVVGGGGLAGWSYAAVITFAAGFGPVTQLVLAYLAGGLPFALVAGLLVRPWRANVAAAGICAGLIMAGFLMVPSGPLNVLTLYADYARSFFTGGTTAGIY